MYLKYEELDFHRPGNLVFAYDMPSMANAVAIPIMKEWDLKFASAKLSTGRDVFNKAENWYFDNGLPSKWQNKGPSRNEEVQKQGKLLDSLVDKFAVVFHYQTDQSLKLPNIFPKFHCLH